MGACYYVETNAFWKDQSLPLCVVAPLKFCHFILSLPSGLFPAMNYNMLICMECLIFALDFIWFAEDGEIL